jgi:hypothetical protein
MRGIEPSARAHLTTDSRTVLFPKPSERGSDEMCVGKVGDVQQKYEPREAQVCA